MLNVCHGAAVDSTVILDEATKPGESCMAFSETTMKATYTNGRDVTIGRIVSVLYYRLYICVD